jgi:hypothetical protein
VNQHSASETDSSDKDEQYRNMMFRFEEEAFSFVIRLWFEHQNNESDGGEWRGWIHALQSGEKHYFRDVSQIAQIIDQYVLQTPGEADGSQSEGNSA